MGQDNCEIAGNIRVRETVQEDIRRNHPEAGILELLYSTNEVIKLLDLKNVYCNGSKPNFSYETLRRAVVGYVTDLFSNQPEILSAIKKRNIASNGFKKLSGFERYELSRNGIETKGYSINPDSVKERAYDLSQNLLFYRLSKGKLSPNWEMINEKLSREFHGYQKKSPNAVRTMVWKYRKSLETKASE